MNLLIVDDEPRALDGIRRSLRLLAKDWNLTFAQSAEQALQALSERSFDVVVTDLHMPGADGVGLLREAQRRWPSVLRIITSGSCDGSKALESVGVAPQFLYKPYQPVTLQAAVARAAHMQHLVTDPGLASFASGLQWLPTLPDTYQRITAALHDESMPLREVGMLIEQDPALTAKILQIVNSAFFGLPREVVSPAEAAVLLGGEILRGVVLAADVFAEREADERVLPVVRSLWQHSLEAAHVTRSVSRTLQCPREVGDAAFLAALVHDVGSLVMLLNQPDAYLQAMEVARRTSRPLHEVEAEFCGTTHAHVAGFLLSRWGLPDAVVMGAALHHRPDDAAVQERDVLCVLHLTDALMDAGGGGQPPALSETYLAKIGIADAGREVRLAIEAG